MWPRSPTRYSLQFLQSRVTPRCRFECNVKVRCKFVRNRVRRRLSRPSRPQGAIDRSPQDDEVVRDRACEQRCARRNIPCCVATPRIRRRRASESIPPTGSSSSSSTRRNSPDRSSTGIAHHGESSVTNWFHTPNTSSIDSSDGSPHISLSDPSAAAAISIYRDAVIRSPPATMTNSARRFRLQHDSSCSGHNGRSSPFDVSVSRVESTPRSTR